MNSPKNYNPTKFLKLSFFLALAALCIPFKSSSQGFTINGTVANAKPEAKIFLSYRKAFRRVVDTVNIENGHFSFTETSPESMVTDMLVLLNQEGRNVIFAPKTGKDFQIVYAGAGVTTITVQDSMKNATVTGKIQDELKKYAAAIYVPGADKLGLNGVSVLVISSTALSQTTRKDTSDQEKKLYARLAQQKAFLDQRHELQRKYIAAHPDSYGSLLAVQEIGGAVMNEEGIADLFNSLSPELRNSFEGKTIADKIEKGKVYMGKNAVLAKYEESKAKAEAREKALRHVGDQAPDFVMNDVNGKAVKLSDFKGKYVLIDFWASWCGPCRQENPNVVKAYKDFKDKNFTVLGVALEKSEASRDAWLAAIKKDGLLWTEVSDFSFWNSPVVKSYGIQSIPQNFLVDPSGKIVAMSLRAEDLQKKLAELLNN